MAQRGTTSYATLGALFRPLGKKVAPKACSKASATRPSGLWRLQCCSNNNNNNNNANTNSQHQHQHQQHHHHHHHQLKKVEELGSLHKQSSTLKSAKHSAKFSLAQAS